jgi:hypothetical protein
MVRRMKNGESIAIIMAEYYENNSELANAAVMGELSDEKLRKYQAKHTQLAEKLEALGREYKILDKVDLKSFREIGALLTEVKTAAILEAGKGFRTLLTEGAKYESNRIAIDLVKRLAPPEKIAEYIKNDTPLIEAHQEVLQQQLLQNLRLFLQEIIKEADEQNVEIQDTKDLVELANALEQSISLEPADENSVKAPHIPGRTSRDLEL